MVNIANEHKSRTTVESVELLLYMTQTWRAGHSVTQGHQSSTWAHTFQIMETIQTQNFTTVSVSTTPYLHSNVQCVALICLDIDLYILFTIVYNDTQI